jgi:hypothetical protein
MNDSRSPSSSQKPLSGLANEAACAFSFIGCMLSGVAFKYWPDHTTVDDSLGVWPIFWIFAGAGLGVLGFVGVMTPALMVVVRRQPRLGFVLIAIGLAITVIGALTVTEWQAVPLPDHGP